MRTKAISAAIVASMVWQSTAQAQFGYGLAGGMPQCPYGFGGAQGANSGDDEVSELMEERLEKKRDKREKERTLRDKMREQDRKREVITNSIQSTWHDAIFEHMDNGYQCGCAFVPAGGPPPYGGPGPQFVPGPSGGPVEPNTPPTGGGGAPPTRPPGGDGGGAPPTRPPGGGDGKDRDTGRPSRAPAPVPRPAPGTGSDGGARTPGATSPPVIRPQQTAPSTFAPIPDRGDASAVWTGDIALVNPARPMRASADANAMMVAAAPASGTGGGRGPASVSAAVDNGSPEPSRGPAQFIPPPPRGGSSAPPGYDYGGGYGGGAPAMPGPPAPSCLSGDGRVFGTQEFRDICENDGNIKSRACTDVRFRAPSGRGGGGANAGGCTQALSRYRKLVKDIDKLQREISGLETEISDLSDAIGDARRSAREDARLEAECPTCAARGRGGRGSRGGSTGPSTTQSIVGGLLAAGALGLGYVANRQMNQQNQALGYPGQSFLPYAGYWAGQGVMQAAFGYPFAGGGMYGGVGAGVNGGFGCGVGIGGGGFPFGPMGAGNPYAMGMGAMGSPFGSPYGAQFPMLAGGMFNPGVNPMAMMGAGGFGNPYSPYAQLAGGYNPYAMTPYGNAGGGFNPMAFGAYPGVPGLTGGAGIGIGIGGGYNPYTSGGYNPYMAYNPYNPLGAYGAGAGLGVGTNPYLLADYQRRAMDGSLSSTLAYGNLAGQMQMLQTNLGQLNSGFGTTYNPYAGYASGSPYIVPGSTSLGVGAGYFGVSPLGTYNYYGSGTTTDTSNRTR